MAGFIDYLDAGYLPGEVRRSSYGDASPFSALRYELSKRFKFKPQSDVAGKYMKEFSALSDNPDALVNASMDLPSDFVQMMNYLKSSGGA
jgi:hypothetical protein